MDLNEKIYFSAAKIETDSLNIKICKKFFQKSKVLIILIADFRAKKTNFMTQIIWHI